MFQEPKVDLRQQQLERLTQVFAKVNSVLTLRKTKVEVVDKAHMKAPAWSDSQTVTFNAAWIGEVTNTRDLAWLKGLDLHEVAHILYTPRRGSELTQWVIDNNLFPAFNALEDQRIETLLVGRYPSITPWLQATIARYFLDEDAQNSPAWQNSYALLRGRKYLDPVIRSESRKAWHDQSTLDELIEIVDAYRNLAFPRDYEDAKDLIKRYSDLLPREQQQSPDGASVIETVVVYDPFGHGGRETEGIDSSISRPVKQQQQQRDAESAKRNEVNEDEDVEDEVEDSQSDSGESDDESTTDAPTPDASGSDAPSQPSDAPSGNSTDAGSGLSSKTAALLHQAIDDLFEDESKSLELENLVRQVKGLPTLTEVNAGHLTKAKFTERRASDQAIVSARAFGRELERIKASVDPSWERNVERGRLNPLRYERGDDIKTVFDRWDEGKADATDIECVVLLDTSGSMVSQTEPAYESMFALKHALDRINADTTVLTFSSGAEVLYDTTDKAHFTIRDAGCSGGTEPLDAIKYATNVLAKSSKAVRLLFVITDGAWYHAEESEQLIERMRNAGVLTALAYIGRGVVESHNCEIVHQVNHAADLLPLGRKLVKTGIARRLTNA